MMSCVSHTYMLSLMHEKKLRDGMHVSCAEFERYPRTFYGRRILLLLKLAGGMNVQ